MPAMRAKVKCTEVRSNETGDVLTFVPVAKSGTYPPDGSDEDNTYAKFSPGGKFELHVQNPALLGQFRPGQKYYVDFTPAE